MHSKRYKPTEVDRRTLLDRCALGESLFNQQWRSPSTWNIKRDFYLKSGATKVPKQAQTKRDGVINQQLSFIPFYQ